MTAEEKAKELIEKYKDYVHGYVGSSMLSNYEYPDQILRQAKKCALIAVDEIIKSSPSLPILSDNGSYSSDIYENNIYWNEVKQEIEKL